MYVMTMYSAVRIPLVSNCTIWIRFIIIIIIIIIIKFAFHFLQLHTHTYARMWTGVGI